MRIVLILACLFQSQVFAGDFCQPRQGCTDSMQQIVRQYDAGTTNFAEQTLSAYSGECFHLSWMYNPQHAHHGAFVFFNNKGQMQMYGELGFFHESNPNAGVSADDLLKRFGTQNPGILQINNNNAVVEFKTESTLIRYSYRSNKDASQLYVLNENLSDGYAGYMFCSLSRH